MSDEPLAQSSFLDDPPARRGEYPVPSDARVEYCRSCGAAIVWRRTARGAALPLSAATILWRRAERYALSHFADCPDSREWSQK